MKPDNWFERLDEWIAQYAGQLIIVWVILCPVLVLGLVWFWTS